MISPGDFMLRLRGRSRAEPAPVEASLQPHRRRTRRTPRTPLGWGSVWSCFGRHACVPWVGRRISVWRSSAGWAACRQIAQVSSAPEPRAGPV